MPNQYINRIKLPDQTILYIKDSAESGQGIAFEQKTENQIEKRIIKNTGVIQINNRSADANGNINLTAADVGLDIPLNFIGILASGSNITTEMTSAPSIVGKNSYTPKKGDIILNNANGSEYICIDITEADQENNTPKKYYWEKFGQDMAIVFQDDVSNENIYNHNYPITFSPQYDSSDTTNKLFKNIYFNFNPHTHNLTIGNQGDGKINNYFIHSAMSKDFLDYDDILFPNGFNNIGEVVSLNNNPNAIYKHTNESSDELANEGDLIHFTRNENYTGSFETGWYGCYLDTTDNIKKWMLLIPKNINQSDKLITERTLYYYEGNSNISKLGTITQGTWNGNTISVANGGTGNTSFTQNGILYGNGTNSINSGLMSWGNWTNGTTNGPTIELIIGDNTLSYQLPAIPSASFEQSGVITTAAQTIAGIKTFTSGELGLKCAGANINKILFGSAYLNDDINSRVLIDDNEFASINVKMPFNTTQFSFRQFKINNSEENGITTYSKNSSFYEEYLLPEINNNITSIQTYNILTTKSLVAVAEGGTGQSSFDANKILYGNGSGSIQSEIPEWKAWVAGTTAGPQAVFHIGNANYTSASIPSASTTASGIVTTEAQSFIGNKSFYSIVDFKAASGEGGEIHLNASDANTSQAGIVLDVRESKFRVFGIASADETTITGVGTPLEIDPYSKTITGGYTLTGSLTGHASLDLPLTGGTVTGYILYKSSEIDASKTNNNVSATNYPTTFCIQDTGNRILSCVESVVNNDGNISTYLYARNYNTSGTLVAQAGYQVTVTKAGVVTHDFTAGDVHINGVFTNGPAGNQLRIRANEISYKGSSYDFTVFRVIDGGTDWGHRLIIGAAGGSGANGLGGQQVVIGGGESAGNYVDAVSTNNENLVLLADNVIHIEAGANTIADRKGFTVTSAAEVIPTSADAYTSGIGTIGTNGYKWNTMYANNFYGYFNGNCSGSSGSCTGNAATATKATQDGSGNTITSTYLKLSGGTMTGNITMPSGGRIGESGGALYLGNSNNASWVYVQDIASQNGTDKWKIQVAGNATFAGTVTAGTFSGSLTGNATTATTASSCSGNAATATKLSTNASNTTASFWRGDNTWSNQLANYIFNTTDIAEGAANLSATATAHKINFYRNGLTIPYQMDNANDGGILRVRGTSESNCIFELGTWDDSGAGETIQFNYYPTNSQTTPTYSVTVPKASGTIALTNGTGASGTWGISITGNCGGSSSSCTGNAATATKLTTDAGNSNTPVYFSDGKPVATNNKLGAISANGYWGMRGADNGDSWIRTTSLGIIPVQAGNAGSGHCGLGTSTWYFSYAYVDNYYGNWNGNAISVPKGGTGATNAAGARTNLGIKSETLTDKTLNSNKNYDLGNNYAITSRTVIAAGCTSTTAAVVPYIYNSHWWIAVRKLSDFTPISAEKVTVTITYIQL